VLPEPKQTGPKKKKKKKKKKHLQYKPTKHNNETVGRARK
jgi:hypothetical protein